MIFRAMYGEQFQQFLVLRKKYDTHNVFVNPWLRCLLDDTTRQPRPSPYSLAEATYTVFDDMSDGFVEQ